MAESGEGDVRPLNPKIGEQIGHIVNAKGFDEESKQEKPLTANKQEINKDEEKREIPPLNAQAQEKIGHIVSATGFDETEEERVEDLGANAKEEVEKAVAKKDEEYFLEDIDNEPLPTPEREKIRSMYREFVKILPKLGFDEGHIKFGTTHPIVVHFVGIEGKFGISIVTERDKEDRKKITKRHISIDKLRDDAYPTSESYWLSSDGYGYYSKYVIDKRGYYRKTDEGGVGKTSDGKDKLVAKKLSEALEPIIDSGNNPEYSVEKIRERVKEIRKSLMDYFKAQGIEPKFETKDFYHKTPEELANLLEASGHKDADKEGNTYKMTIAKVYENVQLPGMDELWDVKFDVDQDNDIMRAHGQKTKAELIHGIGLVITKSEDRDKEDWAKRRYELWENGDAQTLEAAIKEAFGVHDSGYIHDSHQVLIDCLKLESALTGKPLPPELLPLPPKEEGLRDRLKKIALR